MFKQHSVCPVSSLTLMSLFLSKYIRVTLAFKVTQSRNSACISSHIWDDGPSILRSRTWPYSVTRRHRSHHHSHSNMTPPARDIFDTPGAIFYRCSIVNKSVSPAIFETMGSQP